MHDEGYGFSMPHRAEWTTVWRKRQFLSGPWLLNMGGVGLPIQCGQSSVYLLHCRSYRKAPLLRGWHGWSTHGTYYWARPSEAKRQGFAPPITFFRNTCHLHSISEGLALQYMAGVFLELFNRNRVCGFEFTNTCINRSLLLLEMNTI